MPVETIISLNQFGEYLWLRGYDPMRDGPMNPRVVVRATARSRVAVLAAELQFSLDVQDAVDEAAYLVGGHE